MLTTLFESRYIHRKSNMEYCFRRYGWFMLSFLLPLDYSRSRLYTKTQGTYGTTGRRAGVGGGQDLRRGPILREMYGPQTVAK